MGESASKEAEKGKGGTKRRTNSRCPQDSSLLLPSLDWESQRKAGRKGCCVVSTVRVRVCMCCGVSNLG